MIRMFHIRQKMRGLAVFLIVAASAPVCSAPAQAGALGFDPILLEFVKGQATATLSITNRALDQTTVQIRAFAWSQDQDADPLIPTDDIVISPPEAQIPPGETQVVRLLLRVPSLTAEQHYRLLVDQIGSPAQGFIAIALHVSLPVIVDGTVAKPAPLQWRTEPVAGHRVALAAYNPGPSFLRISYIEAELPDGVKLPVKMAGQNPFVLPGMTRHWYLDLPAGAPSAGQLDLRTHFGTRIQDTSLSYAF